MATIPEFPKFQLDEEPTSLGQKWIKWTITFENIFVALNISTQTKGIVTTLREYTNE